MTTAAKHALTIFFDGHHWQAVDANQNMMTLTVDDDDVLPRLPDGSIVQRLLLPAEQLLSRTFHLPFSNPKFIDQDILAQELEEHSSESSESWWLAWQASKYADGVAGIMLGLPESLRQHIESHPDWQHSQYITSDMWLRLNNQYELSLESHPEINHSKSDLAVFDTDSNGMFFGLWQASGTGDSAGFWRAMRRLNWPESSVPSTSLVDDIKRSLYNMGWHDEQTLSIGKLSPQLHAALQLPNWQGQLCDNETMPSRANATITAASTSNINASNTLNFRHGRWRSGSHLNQLKPWYRSMAWAALLMLLWLANMMWQNHQLQTTIETQQQAIIQSFHLGLPHESVMIDALAQLRKAAGGKTSRTSLNNRTLTTKWLRQIENINQVYQQIPWTIKELSFQQGSMSMSGQTSDLQTMNRIQKALQQKSSQDIKIQDTNLSQDQVRFKMVWL